MPDAGKLSDAYVARIDLIETRHWTLSGQVQGVGFRPFIYRLARQYRLTGWVRNCVGLVEVQAQGWSNVLNQFARDIVACAPPLAQPKLDACELVANNDEDDFKILDSLSTGEVQIHVPTDLFICGDCLAEMNHRGDRRYRYPFINCTQCGPRYTLIRDMPYDRPNTTMAEFKLCQSCNIEYEDPGDRRFHAEPIACPDCGPTLEFRSLKGKKISGNEASLSACLAMLKAEGIVAVKGIGGYHLMCDARSDIAVNRLRELKPRPDKPLAVMFPSPPDDPLCNVKHAVTLSTIQAKLLCSPARPIVLANKRINCGLATAIAPGLNEIGVMLAYSPLHHLLLNDFDGPLVATSANISGEPVLIAGSEVESRLDHVIDGCLHHNRVIERPADDSVFRFIAGSNRPIRLGRGHQQLELELPFTLTRPVLAVGGQMKSTIALAWANNIVVSPHIGDMGFVRSLELFERNIIDLQSLYRIKAEAVICDAHPGYASTRYAQHMDLPIYKVWHHHAHASAAYGEEPGDNSWLVFTWDGVGYGEDGNLWGGEALLGQPGNWRRVATMRTFRLPGGERASREPWRSAAALCWELGLHCPVAPGDTTLLHSAWKRQLNAPTTSSAGRLFDAAAALAGVCDEASFEGQAPMYLEALCRYPKDAIELPLARNAEGLWVSDWEPLVEAMLDISNTQSDRAALAHATMARVIVDQAIRIRTENAVKRVALCGGVFQNRVLTETAKAMLGRAGFTVTLPAKMPVNDAGLSFGQIIEFGYQRL